MNPFVEHPYALIAAWSCLGLSAWGLLTAERYENDPNDPGDTLPPFVDESKISRAQFVFLHLVCGPFVWISDLWNLLGRVGRS